MVSGPRSLRGSAQSAHASGRYTRWSDPLARPRFLLSPRHASWRRAHPLGLSRACQRYASAPPPFLNCSTKCGYIALGWNCRLLTTCTIGNRTYFRFA
ncbi:hypothetical protein ACFFX0_31920 [Citricoccus parietis]|uniref:Uncharacterized protein n=1 Tax=Citricoccus parietis TaxID=592307 RepID=A0ABV5GAP5_9MICC